MLGCPGHRGGSGFQWVEGQAGQVASRARGWRNGESSVGRKPRGLQRMAKKGRCVEGLRRRRGVTVSFPRNLGTWYQGPDRDRGHGRTGPAGLERRHRGDTQRQRPYILVCLPDVEKGPVYVPAFHAYVVFRSEE